MEARYRRRHRRFQPHVSQTTTIIRLSSPSPPPSTRHSLFPEFRVMQPEFPPGFSREMQSVKGRERAGSEGSSDGNHAPRAGKSRSSSKSFIANVEHVRRTVERKCKPKRSDNLRRQISENPDDKKVRSVSENRTQELSL